MLRLWRGRAQTVGPGYTIPPSIAYGELYRDVELASIFPDSKTFPDMIPDAPPDVLDEYRAAKQSPSFDLAAFVQKHFTGPTPPGPAVNPAAPGQRLLDYVMSLWPILQQDATSVPPYSTLLTLPVPQCRARRPVSRVHHRDSYFTMLGLEDDGQHQLALDLLNDFAFELDHYGKVPNQPQLLPQPLATALFLIDGTPDRVRGGTPTEISYLPLLQQEWDFWMEGADRLPPGELPTVRCGCRMGPFSTAIGMPATYRGTSSDKEDVETADASSRPAELVYRDLRAAAESGLDFSSRWLADGKTLATVRTLSILPVDLNCLLVHLEETLSQAYRAKGDVEQAAVFHSRAQSRSEAIRRLMWDGRDGVFSDDPWQTGEFTGAATAAMLYPLFLRIATASQARVVARTVARTLLDVGGLATTCSSPAASSGTHPMAGRRCNGSPWWDCAIMDSAARSRNRRALGAREYRRLPALCETGREVQVTTPGGDEGGGGEYATQIGFGWTNGVLVALTSLYPDLKAEAARAVPR